MISDAALVASTAATQERARIAQTLPALTRSAPAAAPTPLVAPFSPSAAALDDTYPPVRQRGGKWPLLLGAAAVLAVAGIAVVKLTASPEKPAAITGSATAAVAPEVSAPPAAAPEPPAPSPTETAPAAAAVAPAASEAPPPKLKATEPEPTAPTKRAKPVKKPAAPAPRKVAAKPEPKAAAAPAPEPAPAAAPKPAKGVIVRETPF